MDSLVLIERLDELMAEAKPIPFTREARVDRDEVYKILDRIRTTLPVEFERARWTGREDSQEDAVEKQLRQLGASLAEVRRAQQAQVERRAGAELTTAATERVHEIVEAAERTAAELEQEAEAEARRLRAEAARDLKSAREESERLLRESRERAAAEAADYLRRVEEATQKMLERAAAADSEINGMIARLRGTGGSVIEDLEAIMSGLTQIEVRRSGAPQPERPKGQGSAPEQPEPVAVSPGGAPVAARVAAAGARPRVPAGGQDHSQESRRQRPAPGQVKQQPAPPPARQEPASLRPATPEPARQQPGPAAVARRPVPAPVEGLQDPPEPPAIGAQRNSTSPAGEESVGANSGAAPQTSSPPSAA